MRKRVLTPFSRVDIGGVECLGHIANRRATSAAAVALSLLLLLPFAAGCRKPALPPPETDVAPRRGWSQTGEASYYSDKFRGRKTASGQRYDPRLLTGAHRTLPFGTAVRVTRLEDGRSVVVRVNDRGPFRRSRIIDLSRAAAERLDMIRAGTARVRLELAR